MYCGHPPDPVNEDGERLFHPVEAAASVSASTTVTRKKRETFMPFELQYGATYRWEDPRVSTQRAAAIPKIILFYKTLNSGLSRFLQILILWFSVILADLLDNSMAFPLRPSRTPPPSCTNIRTSRVAGTSSGSLPMISISVSVSSDNIFVIVTLSICLDVNRPGKGRG